MSVGTTISEAVLLFYSDGAPSYCSWHLTIAIRRNGSSVSAVQAPVHTDQTAQRSGVDPATVEPARAAYI